METTGSCLFRRYVPLARSALARSLRSHREPVEKDVNHGSRVERKDLAEDKSADHSDTERPAELRSDTAAESQRKPGEKSGHRGHHDGTKAQQASLVDSLRRA